MWGLGLERLHQMNTGTKSTPVSAAAKVTWHKALLWDSKLQPSPNDIRVANRIPEGIAREKAAAAVKAEVAPSLGPSPEEFVLLPALGHVLPSLRGKRNRLVLRDLRQRKYKTVGDLAEAHGFSASYLKRWLSQRPYLVEDLPCGFLQITTKMEAKNCSSIDPIVMVDAPSMLPLMAAVQGDLIHKNYTGWWMSEKLDGVRALWNGETFVSRHGLFLTAPSFFTEGLPKRHEKIFLDGELFGGRGHFQATVGTTRSPSTDPRWKNLKFRPFDCPSHGKVLRFEERTELVKDCTRRTHSEFVQCVEQVRVKSQAHLTHELESVLSQGGEGLMLRQPLSYYEHTRSATMVKLKSCHEMEARVIGHMPAKTLTGDSHVGALLCEIRKTFKVGSGLTRQLRENPPSIGATISVKYQNLTDSGLPRFPVFQKKVPPGLMNRLRRGR